MTSVKLFDDKWLKKPSKKELYDLVEEQQKEIKELKEEIEYLKEGKPIFKSIALEVYEENERRISKAIEYLKSKEWAIDYEKSSCRTHLLEILRGELDEG